MHKELISLGYRLNHNIDTYIYKAPVQYYIPLRDKETGERLTAEQIIHKCEKGVRYSVRIGDQRGLVSKICTYDDIKADPTIIDDFMLVMGDYSPFEMEHAEAFRGEGVAFSDFRTR